MSSRERPGVVIGLDLGTSGARAVALTERLTPLAEATRSYAVQLTEDGGAEQSVPEVAAMALEALTETVAALGGAGRVLALALSGTASSLARFEADQPAAAAWLWSDVRAGAEAEELRRRFGLDAFRRTGCPAHASYWPAKLRRWRPGRSPNLRLAGIKDYLFFRLTGEWLCDRTTAAATGLYDSQAGRWDRDLLQWLELDETQLPELVAPTDSRPLLGPVAQALGLPLGTPVLVGSVDGVLAHLGLGCFSATDRSAPVASCMVGTSGAVRVGAPSRALDTAARTWTYPAGGDLWVMGGAVNNGGNVLTWLGALLGGSEPLTPDRLVSMALQARPGGPIFLPYIYGERSPLWREDLRGSLLGLSPLHGPDDVARAVVEGISLGLDHVLQVLAEQAGQPAEVRASGGFLGSPPWLQFQADVFGIPLVVTDQEQAVSTGAAMLAWQSVTGASLGEMSRVIRPVRRYEPDMAAHGYFRERFAQSQELRRRLWGEGDQR